MKSQQPDELPRVVQVSAETTIFTFAYLYLAARVSREQATREAEGSTYHFLNGLMCCAFAVEAYFNHLGVHRFKTWANIERSLSPHQKLDLLTESLGFVPDMGSRPYQSLHSLFSFRNTVAHGKTETISKSWEQPLGADSFEELMPDWMAQCNATFVDRMLEDARAAIIDLHARAGLGGNPLPTLQEGSRSEHTL